MKRILGPRATVGFCIAVLGLACDSEPPSGDGHPEEAFPGRRGEKRRGLFETARGTMELDYELIEGRAIFQGDIVLAESEASLTRSELRIAGAGRSTVRFRWPGMIVPYRIDSALPGQNRIHQAIAHWESNTQMRFVQQTTEPDYVEFVPGTGCSSFVGRIGMGAQQIQLAGGCGTGAAIHEIGHAVGLWHEQSRTDRDQFVIIHLGNVEAMREHNFAIYQDGADYGAYDLGSIMHYSSYDFSANGSPTITRLDGSTFEAQREGLSGGDIAAVHEMYGVLDSDHDGYTIVAGDCNDHNAAIHPGATEICSDNVDQDCSGADISCLDIDHDGDGYTENQGDCDDTRSSSHPSAAELCNGADDDCDLSIDPDCDDDADGLTNSREWTLGTNPNAGDTDSDGLLDGRELEVGTDPLAGDSDADALLDGYEVDFFASDPLDPDTDDDLLNDGEELRYGTEPRLADTDLDGLLDGEEVHTHGSEPTNPNTDADCLNDGAEVSAARSPIIYEAAEPVFAVFLDAGEVEHRGKLVPFVLENRGNVDLNLRSLRSLGGAFEVGEYPGLVRRGSTIRVMLLVRAEGTGILSDTLRVETDACPSPNPTFEIEVRASRLMSRAVASPIELDFGEAPVGQVVTRYFDLSAVGNRLLRAALTSRDPVFYPTFDRLEILAGQTDSIPIQFIPYRHGLFEGTILISAFQDPAQPEIEIVVHGKGVGEAPSIRLGSDSLDFGVVAVNSESTIELSVGNSGPGRLYVTHAEISGSNISGLELGAARFTVAPGQTRLVPVRFTPRAAGQISGSIVLQHNDPTAGTRVELRGVAQ